MSWGSSTNSFFSKIGLCRYGNVKSSSEGSGAVGCLACSYSRTVVGFLLIGFPLISDSFSGGKTVDNGGCLGYPNDERQAFPNR